MAKIEATYKTSNGRLVIKVSGESQKELFKELSAAQQVFDVESKCGVCGGTEVHFQARTANENDYFELVCRNQQCKAVFPFGQHKKGNTLFPKYDPGWHKWSKSDVGSDY